MNNFSFCVSSTRSG